MGYSNGSQGYYYRVLVRELAAQKGSAGYQPARWFEFEPSRDAAAAKPWASFDEERRETLESVLEELRGGNCDPSSRGACVKLLRHLALTASEGICDIGQHWQRGPGQPAPSRST